MSRRALAIVANFHRERRLGAKTARFLAASQAHLAARGIDLAIEFVLDRADVETRRRIELAAGVIPGSRLHELDLGNLGAARAHGVTVARSDIVCFVDGDDFFSMNWFEAALDALSGHRRREIVHTQFLVGFGEEQFVRETMDSRDPAFDPLSLAVDWYWNGNLGVRADLFAEVPIEPYDHDAGFGSEDWHWSANTLAAGIARVAVPDTCYYYRIKPPKRALGRVGEVIHRPSRLYDAPRPRPPAAPASAPLPVSPLGAGFFAQAREIEAFDLGVSFLRAVEAGALSVRRFKPHTPPLVGRVLREAAAAGFGDGSAIVFADAGRLPGGLATAAGLADALAPGDPPRPRLYVVEGETTASRPVADGYLLSVGELREARLNLPQRQRLIARFMLQSARLTVVNALSPRARSLALGYSRATRANIARWVNIVTEYGLDALSQSFEELDAFREAGLPAENLAVFEKTAREARAIRGQALLHDPDLEEDWANGSLGSRRVTPVPLADADPPPPGGEDQVALALEDRRGRLSPTEAETLRRVVERFPSCRLALAGARSGVGGDEPAEPPGWRGLRIPLLTVIGQGEQPNFNLRHPFERLNARLAKGEIPAELLLAGVIAIDSASARAVLADPAAPPSLGRLIRAAAAAAAASGVDALAPLPATDVSEIGQAELEALDAAGLALALNAEAAA